MKNLIRASIKTASSVALLNLAFIGSVKLIALNFGSSGVGLFSLLKQIISTFSSLGIGAQTSVVLGTSANKGVKKDRYIKTSFYFYLLISAVSFILFVFNVDILARIISPNSIAEVLFLPIPIMLLIWYTFFKSIINGYNKIGTLSLLETISPLLIFFLLGMILFFDFYTSKTLYFKYVLVLALAQLMAVLASFLILFKMKINLLNSKFRFHFNSPQSIFFMRTSFVTIVTGVVSAISLFLVRASVIKGGGLSQAGIFDIAWTISNTYPMLILTALSTYYLPNLSSIKNKQEKIEFINKTLRYSIIFITPIIMLVIALKPFIITVISTKSFIPSLEIFRWTLIADYFKVTSWIFALATFAKNEIKFYCISEVVWYFFLAFAAYLASCYFHNLEFFGAALIGLFFLSSLNYLVHSKKVYKLMLEKNIFSLWALSLLSIIIFSLFTWRKVQTDWVDLCIWAIFLLLYVNFVLRKTEKEFLQFSLIKLIKK